MLDRMLFPLLLGENSHYSHEGCLETGGLLHGKFTNFTEHYLCLIGSHILPHVLVSFPTMPNTHHLKEQKFNLAHGLKTQSMVRGLQGRSMMESAVQQAA